MVIIFDDNALYRVREIKSLLYINRGNNDFLKDNAGNVVITQLNETMCREIAQAGTGLYVRADNTNNALRTLQSELNKMSKSEVESTVYSEYDEQFPTLAWITLTLLFVEVLTSERKNRLFRNIKLFNRD